MLILAIHVWNRRALPGGFYFSLLMVSAALWAFTSGMESSVIDISIKIFFSKLSYLGIATIAPLWLLFTLDYSNNKKLLESKWIMLIWIIPIIIIFLTFTNEFHNLIWTSITPVSNVPGDFLIYGHGIAVYINITYSYALMFFGSFILLQVILRSYEKYHAHAITLLLGALIPLIANALYMTIDPIKGLDITPFAFAITGSLYTWGIFRQNIFDLVPLARDVLIDEMAGGILLFDKKVNLVDINPAARKMLGLSDTVSKIDIQMILSKWPEFNTCIDNRLTLNSEAMIKVMDKTVWLDIYVTDIKDEQGRIQGHLVTFWDITVQKKIEEELTRVNTSLKQEIEERRKVEIKLESSLKEKELLLKEIHHRVKNNLTIISSILSLQTMSMKDKEVSLTLTDCQNRVKSMALIHEKLYRSSDLSHVDFKEYVQSLLMSLSRSYIKSPGISIEYDIDGISLDIDSAIPCGLIINELVSNSLKHAFKDGNPGIIKVSMKRSNGTYELIVSDNGSGLPEWVDYKNTASLGLQLVVTLTEQLKGKIELYKDKGTAFKISFKEF
jgi:PAS domain S-box-containing protein